MSIEEERRIMEAAAVKDAVETAEQVETTEAIPDTKPLNEVSGWTDADDEDRVGWLIISDGEQEVLPHPEGKTRLEVIESFLKAKSKKHNAFQIGYAVLDPEVITTFAWSEDVMFPQIDKFDSIQERMEGLADAMIDLTRQQAALQDAHAALIQDEIMHAVEGDEEEEGAEQSAVAPEVLAAGEPVEAKPIKATTLGKKAFRPPGA
jgi:hypothetical protein